jgi:iron complex outermembrane receptor protein
MTRFTQIGIGVLFAALCGPASGLAQGTGTGQTQNPPPPPQDPTKPITRSETVVVSASKTEQEIAAAPATMTVIGPATLSIAPSNSFADVLRGVPGLNITQISARDVNVSSRGATGSLATSQLAVLDGRSLYQDFFGFTMWDFMPANLDEIKRIEVIRGPASAIWGANALSGVINIITKSPREMPGQTLTFGVGTFNRTVGDTDADAGALFYVRGTHAQVLNDRWAMKLSAGTYESDALARPTGLIPGTTTAYPPYPNTGTAQPKLDVRFDYTSPDGQRNVQLQGGIAGTDGIMHTGIGPFDIATGTRLGYWKATFTQNNFRLQTFMNILNGTAGNLLSTDPSGDPIGLEFDTTTFDVEVGDTRLAWNKHVFTYGGNVRLNRFDLTIAPGEDSRTEGGAYIQDEFLLSTKTRLVAGARLDKFSSIEDAVFSPRVAFIVMPTPVQSVRFTYNRAFRAPSMVNNNLDITVGTPLPLGLVNPAFGNAIFYVPTDALGNTALTEERVDAFEVAYTGTIGNRATVTAAYYRTDFSDAIAFTQDAVYGIAEPPPGFPGLGPFTPAQVWGGIFLSGIRFPKSFTYKNLGQIEQQGIELGVDATLTSRIGAFLNYAFQADPKPSFPGFTEDQALDEINHPAKHLVNAGVSYVDDRLFGTLTVSYSDRAFWQDVLDSRFSGETAPYTLVNLTAGVKFNNNRYSVSLKATNLLNDEVQQHVFGDVFKRQIVGEFRINLPR